MKVSLRWIFDHIHGSWQDIDVAALVKAFNQKTAEIERWYSISVDLERFTLAETKRKFTDQVVAHSPEWNEDFNLPMRDDVADGRWFLVCKDGNTIRWATSHDLGAEKLMVLPPLFVKAGEQAGGWKKWFEATDYILEVDNKSITHRPDLWGQRGFAREIAAILDKSMIPLDDFLAKWVIESYENESPATHGSPFSVAVETDRCKRFATLYIHNIESRSSLLWMTTRLSRLDSRCIDTIVDTTNYVMLDLSQPMHAFDAQRFESEDVVVRMAPNKAKLTLLDSQKISLTQNDIIIADGQTPISLAGIMGGASTAVSAKTKQLLLESANFDATTIRKSSVGHKLRTEASARFEKGIDPNQNTQALLRFLYLIQNAQLEFDCSSAIMSIGKVAEPMGIDIAHAFIEQRLGTTVAEDFVVNTLRRLDFTVDQYTDNGMMYYFVTAPVFRCIKDITLPEDIVEEVGRFFGYDAIKPVLPSLQLSPKNMHAVLQLRLIKQVLAYVFQMHEVHNYAFYDESLLRELSWEPADAVAIKNPVSENAKRLVTSLIPHVLKSVQQNAAEYDQLRFFECARVWEEHRGITEHKKIAGVFYDAKKDIDFYEAKALVERLFTTLQLPVTYEPVSEPTSPWFTPYKSAYILHDGKSVGIMGIVPPLFLSRLCEGNAFVFELNGDFLLQYQPPLIKCIPLPKYPLVERDISMLVPLAVTVRELTDIIEGAHSAIIGVELIDFFAKKEWHDQKAVTFRYICKSEHKTMEKSEIEAIAKAVATSVQQAGATIR